MWLTQPDEPGIAESGRKTISLTPTKWSATYIRLGGGNFREGEACLTISPIHCPTESTQFSYRHFADN
jgi:hypothetical protein